MSKMFSLYIDRRISVPIGARAIMLDVGCGDKPHWRADVLVDKFIDAKHAPQRNFAGPVAPLAPLFEAELESLPFRDDAFDFVYCSHVLEHTVDPAAAVKELLRVGKCGYIEVPFSGIQKIYDHETHLWYCSLEGRTLRFTAKAAYIFDHDIEGFLNRGVRRTLAFLMNFYPDAAMIRLHWSPSEPINVEVVGEPNLELAVTITDDTAKSSRRDNPLRLLRFTLRSLLFWKRRRRAIYYNDIVKPEFHLSNDAPLTSRIYRVEQHQDV